MTSAGRVHRTAVGSWACVDVTPRPIGAEGVTVAVAATPERPGERDRGPQAIVAQARDAAGWSVGLSADGRATVSVGTGAGPVSLSAGDRLPAGVRVEIVARIPGAPGGRLEIEVSRPGRPPCRAGVVLGAAVMTARGPLLCGCRELRDDRIPQQPFEGGVEDPVVVADAAAPGPRAMLREHRAVVVRADLSAVFGPSPR
ncbi:MAG: hypothetical protein QM604_11630 [Microbacterium sp.]